MLVVPSTRPTTRPGGGEFYFNDSFDPGPAGGLVHNETSLGSIAVLPGSGEVVSTHFDAVRHVPDGQDDPEPRNGGVRFHSSADGTVSHWYEIYPDTDNVLGTFAKAAGLGDLELICAPAPIEIGNYVWLDSDNDGVQDPGETPLAGVTVELVNGAGQVIGTAVTDAAGQYYFSSAGGTSTASAIYNIAGLVLNGTGFQVRIPLNQVPLAGLEPAQSNAGGIVSNDNKLDLHDSDGVSDGTNAAVTFSTGAAGENNHNFDFGFTANVPGIDIEKLTNGNQADGANDPDVPEIAPGDPVTWTYIVTNDGTTPVARNLITVTDDIVGNLMVAGVVQPNVAFANEPDTALDPTDIWTFTVVSTAPDLTNPAQTVGMVIVNGCNPTQQPVPGARATYENIATVTIPGDSDTDPSHFCNPRPGIDIEKLTNGNQADGPNDPDVPEIAPGDPVTWTYIVTNNSLVSIPQADITVSDNLVGDLMVAGVVQPIATLTNKGNGDAVLAPAEAWTFIVTSTAPDLSDPTQTVELIIVDGCNPTGGAVPGPRETYANIGTVTIPGDSDTDPSHFCNPGPGIDIEKLTNGNQADGAADPDVPEIAPGDPVIWSYIITNDSLVDIPQTDITVADDIIGNLMVAGVVQPNVTFADNGNGDAILAPNESWTFTVQQIAPDLTDAAQTVNMTIVDGCNPVGGSVPGPRETYENIATVTIPGDSDTDPSHFCNPVFDLALRKVLGAGQSREVEPGDTVTFTIEVSNQGTITATDIEVTDYIPAGLTLADPNWNGSGDLVTRTIPGPLNPGVTTTLDIVFTVNPGVQPGDLINLAEISDHRDDQGRKPTDKDSTPDKDRNNDGTPKDNVVTEDHKKNPGDDEDDHDPERLVVPAMSLGNRVWLDIGDGPGGVLNDGEINGDEAGIADVKVNLLDGSGNPVLGTDGQPRMTTTDADGYYRFDNLPPGNYIVCLDAANFAADGPLADLRSTNTSEPNPNDNGDSNDNGIDDAQPTANGICSEVVTLTFDSEPLNEPDPNTGGSDILDVNTNLTVDFGLVPNMSLGNRVWLDNGVGGGTRGDGEINGSEAGISDVVLSLHDQNGTPILDSSGNVMTTTTDAQGYYRFDNILPGQYIVCVDAENFATGGPLSGLGSTTTSEGNPNDDGDSNDNGVNGPEPAVNGVCSNPVDLVFFTEPMNEPDQDSIGGQATDNNTNLTVDFGFISGPTSLDEGQEPGRKFDKFTYLPLAIQQ
ncbi:MAG: SdrD B-like domain-containing protein [Caldilineaceae bacterium]